VIFSETLAASRDLLEVGKPVLVTVEGEREGETLKLRAQSVDSLDHAASTVQSGLKVVLDRRSIQGKEARLASLKALLKPGGKGIVRLSLQLDDCGREVEIIMPGRFDISPAQKGAMSVLPGVLDVVDI
jgi:DNA polymerase-3 subunit alpha